MISFTSFGAAEEVTGSKHLIEYNNTKVLLDCGMFQGRRYESRMKNEVFGFDPKKIDTIILSHAHVDHCGLLPLIIKQGFTGNIFCTQATKDLLEVMLNDCAYIQEMDELFYKKHPEIYTPFKIDPLYTHFDVEKCLTHVKTVELHEKIQFKDITFQFFSAGHVIGSVIVKIFAGDNILLFSGDLGRTKMPLLIDRECGLEADIVIMESTYGGKKHDPVDLSNKSLEEVIKKTIARGGKIIIPSFALERTQEILYFLEKSFNDLTIPKIPVYVDSPMAIKVTQIFQKHKETYDTEMMARYYEWEPFSSPNIKFTETMEESKKINEENIPSIIIASSGMCEAGRIRHHLKNSIENHRNTILIVGFMASETLGRKLVEKESRVKIFGNEYRVKAEIIKLNSFSGHADEEDLVSWLSSIKNVKNVILVHGEKDSISALKDTINQKYDNVYIAKMSQCLKLY